MKLNDLLEIILDSRFVYLESYDEADEDIVGFWQVGELKYCAMDEILNRGINYITPLNNNCIKIILD